MYAAADLIPISALQHLLYCQRQFALIHVEQVWDENALTARGKVFHQRAHEGTREVRNQWVIEFGTQVRSLCLGLVGKLDALELEFSDRTLSRLVSATPVEYKVGRPKTGDWDRVQLGAQAIAIEEMLAIAVPVGALYYGKPRRRLQVEVDEGLRRQVEQAARHAHTLLLAGHTPAAIYKAAKCDNCSLFDICRPQRGRMTASDYVSKSVLAALQE